MLTNYDSLTERGANTYLLYVEDDNVRHFALIKDLSRHMRSQITRNKNRKYFCDRYIIIIIIIIIILGVQISSVRFFVHLFQNKMNEQIN